MTTLTQPRERGLNERQAALININVTWLQRALHLLGSIDQQTFVDSPKGLGPHKAGGHLRHILEFYECFLDGLEWGHIDYDARQRDESVERSLAVATARIRSILHRLQNTPELHGDSIVWVKMEDAEASRIQDCFVTSSIGRELQALSSHTVHHFTLIALTLRLLGVEVDPDFGVAPATLRFRESQRQLAVPAEAA